MSMKMLTRLEASGLQLMQEKHVIDEWYAPLDVQSHERQEQWFDYEHGVAYRIRHTEEDDGSFSIVVESKQLTEASNHNTFDEKTLNLTDYSEAREYLDELGYWNWLTIDKTRRQFDAGNSEVDVILDNIAGLAEKIGIGAVLEIEYRGDDDRNKALGKLGAFATDLGLSDEQLFAKSLTVEAMQALAKFEK